MCCQNCFIVYSTKFRWRFSREELKSQIFGGIWVTNYPTAGKSFSAGLSKLKSMCPEDFLRERFFRRTFFGLRAVHLAIFGETIIEYLSKPFSTVFEDFLEKDFWIKEFIYFWHLNSCFWQKSFAQFSIKISTGLSKLHCRSLAEHFVEKQVFWEKMWNFVRIWAKNSQFRRKILGKVIKSA